MIRIIATAVLAIAPAALGTTALAQSSHAAHSHAAFQSDRLHVRVDGAQGLPDLILIPGLSSSPEIWQETVDRLQGQYRIHRIHIQGFAGAEPKANAQPAGGHSPLIAPLTEEIARYIEQDGLKNPAVIGHSFGGTLGMALAARHPQSVSKLLVVDMLPFVGATFGPPGTTSQSVAPIADAIWQGQIGLSHEEYLAAGQQTLAGMINNESRRPMAFEHLRQTDQAVAAGAFRDLIVTDLRGELAQITAPTRVLYVSLQGLGEAMTDMIFSASFAARPDFKLKRIDDSAHFIMFDQAEQFASEVDNFLTSN